jgi:hypothetical protein
MTVEEINIKLIEKFDESKIKLNEAEYHIIEVSSDILVDVCRCLPSSPDHLPQKRWNAFWRKV